MNNLLDKINKRLEQIDEKIAKLESVDHRNMNRVTGVINTLSLEIKKLKKSKEHLIVVSKTIGVIIAFLASLGAVFSFIVNIFKIH